MLSSGQDTKVPKDLFDFLYHQFVADHEVDSAKTEHEADYLQTFITYARETLTANQPVNHRVGAEGFIIQLQDGTVLPIVDVPVEMQGADSPMVGISQAGVRGNETTRTQSWGITGDG